jgi:hypothetical protein
VRVTAALTVVAGVAAVETFSASAATPACGPGCISIFSRDLGTYAQPGRSRPRSTAWYR